jgi:hypothetical protein
VPALQASGTLSARERSSAGNPNENCYSLLRAPPRLRDRYLWLRNPPADVSQSQLLSTDAQLLPIAMPDPVHEPMLRRRPDGVSSRLWRSHALCSQLWRRNALRAERWRNDVLSNFVRRRRLPELQLTGEILAVKSIESRGSYPPGGADISQQRLALLSGAWLSTVGVLRHPLQHRETIANSSVPEPATLVLRLCWQYQASPYRTDFELWRASANS